MTDYQTKDAVAKLGETDPEFAELLKSGATPPPFSLEQAAAFYSKLPIPNPPTTPTDYPITIPVRDGRTTRARVYKPSNPPSTPLPLLVYFHGGGYVLGDPTHVAVTAATLADAVGAVVVAPTYRLAPAHPFPAAPHDAWDAFTWLASPANAATVDADVSAGLAIGGVSAGANLAAVTAQRWAGEARSPALAGAALVIPHLGLEPALVPAAQRELWFSREQNAKALVIDGEAMAFVDRAYAPDHRSPDYSPFNAERPHEAMPPVYLQVNGQDPLRDDGLVYERVLREKGVKTKLDVYPGVPHGHTFMFPTLKSSVQSSVDLIKGVAWLFGKEVDDETAGKVISEAMAAAAAAAASGAANARVN
ncbi:putative alpha beta hydrolase fold-3 domain-containing protein [Neofusicoccum parvum UCRNP2]|uniref:Putative alpha beta hydrolase fold-3 domain-containing protein n=1 Tax=Botryosphaeria parva (strain UCR-NP2) TaxID=1287680 RepID=R1EQ70_BOTPV|nr:putative alpha beta hydrolase fold-3 domain-containing protein [Neofusicoccum parvum UCRNP2]